jgi:L-2-hydroxyglutarate oxidase LhgO
MSVTVDVVDADAVILGAGVVGLACAAALARQGRDVVVLERTDFIGSGVSSRNSEVIHAGIYYPTSSLKQRLCIEGRRRLYAYAQARGIPHRKCGKLIVATAVEEESKVEGLAKLGRENGVENLELVSRSGVEHLEPNLVCRVALHSKETGIIDSHAFMLSLTGELEDHGGALALGHGVAAGRVRPGGFELDVVAADRFRLTCRTLVNALGLHAQNFAATLEGYDALFTPALRLAKGSYFACAGKPAFSRLIYPAPVDGGLGVHLTLDLAGRMRFGPDVEWLASNDPDCVDFAVDPGRCAGFYEAIRRYWPALPDEALAPDYAGVRPKLSGPGEPAADFRVDGPGRHGVEGLVNLFGIESPGLTAALAIAELVARQVAPSAGRAAAGAC